MSQAAGPPLLLRRCFNADLQKAFSHLSGDHNPMHDDPVAARRTLAGAQVVQGIHLALAAMEAASAFFVQGGGGAPRRGITGWTALFQKPVLVGETVGFYLTAHASEKDQIVGRIRQDDVCKITILWGYLAASPADELPPLLPEPVAELDFAHLEGRSGKIMLGLEPGLAHEMFPVAMTLLGPVGMAEVLGLSRLVGMHCPGLHSLFSDCAVDFRAANKGGPLHYRVVQADARFGKIVMQVDGPRLEGKVTAFFRPPPREQPGMAEVKERVEPGSFARTVALIVGGSRGLGEITAKIIAAGGGFPLITYRQGAADAHRVAHDIRSAGGRCAVLPFDVCHHEAFLDQLSAGEEAPLSLYYFATPKIFGRRRGFFDYDLLGGFHAIYVTAFGRLIEGMSAQSGTKLRVFYPSSVAVEENRREMAEYAMAKRAGEELCAFFNRHAGQVEITVERLPRILTDQTSTLMPVPAEEGLAVMLPLVSRIEMPIQQQCPKP